MLKKTIEQPPESGSIDSHLPDTNVIWPSFEQNPDDDRLDHFIRSDGEIYAGKHIIIDIWGTDQLDDLSYMEAAMKQIVLECKATLLHIHLHHFTPNGGISGVAVLAESHISVHTWPEKRYAAFDVFMCGHAEPENSIKVLKELYQPEKCQINHIKRGLLPCPE